MDSSKIYFTIKVENADNFAILQKIFYSTEICRFRLSILFCQYRSCDDPQEAWNFVVHENVQLWKTIFSWVSSHDLYWQNKIDKRKKVYRNFVGRFDKKSSCN